MMGKKKKVERKEKRVMEAEGRPKPLTKKSIFPLNAQSLCVFSEGMVAFCAPHELS